MSTPSLGILQVLEGKKDTFYLEYPCHSPDEQRWFMMRAHAFDLDDERFIVISHHQITERKLAEQKTKLLSTTDYLTKIPNRREFHILLKQEWHRCLQNQSSISLALIDIDHFKLINDTYGHLTGDKCLLDVASVTDKFANRLGEVCARYGGEEFVIVWPNTAVLQAAALGEQLRSSVNALNIPNQQSPVAPHLTVSMGIATLLPDKRNNETDLIALADSRLYEAKSQGRNRICWQGGRKAKVFATA
ncbi:MAG: GGDEF domain-containing protein [Pontibacterium sp.]